MFLSDIDVVLYDDLTCSDADAVLSGAKSAFRELALCGMAYWEGFGWS